MAADPRFYESLGPLSAGEIADKVAGELFGPGDLCMSGIAPPASAGPGDVFFISDSRDASLMKGEGATGLVRDEAAARGLAGRGHAAIVVNSPPAALARAARFLIRPRRHDGREAISPDAEISADVHLAPGCLVAAGARIGAGSEIGPGAVIGPGVEIGENCRIGARASIGFALIGRGVEISAGAVIGEAGFGLAHDRGEMFTLPHVGRVLIGDGVTIGANSTIDRGMFDDTRLEAGCRIDNLCHIAHNCVIGENTVMAAFAGVSGSVEIGRGVQFGGRVGIADHVRIGERARLAADSAVMRDVPPGETWGGAPAQPIRDWMRDIAWLRRQSAQRGKKPGKAS